MLGKTYTQLRELVNTKISQNNKNKLTKKQWHEKKQQILADIQAEIIKNYPSATNPHFKPTQLTSTVTTSNTGSEYSRYLSNKSIEL